LEKTALTAAACLGLSAPLWAQFSAPSPAQWNGLPLGQVQVGGSPVRVVSASSECERVLSLGKYATLAAGEGVLHVFSDTGKRCLLTRQIPLDLDAAYLDANNRVVAIGQLVARQPQAQCGQTPAQQVLTVPKDQLAALDGRAGSTRPAGTATGGVVWPADRRSILAAFAGVFARQRWHGQPARGR